MIDERHKYEVRKDNDDPYFPGVETHDKTEGKSCLLSEGVLGDQQGDYGQYFRRDQLNRPQLFLRSSVVGMQCN